MKNKSIETLVISKVILIATLIALSNNLYSQRLEDLEYLKSVKESNVTGKNFRASISNATEDTLKMEFYNFYIPSAILFSGLEPAATSKLNLGFGEDKVTLKLGRPVNRNGKEDSLINSFAFKFSAAAPDGARAIFKFDNTPRDLSIGAVFTRVNNHELGSMSDGGTKIYTYRRANWFNVNLTYNNTKRIIFADDLIFNTRYYHNYQVMVTYNRYFNGWHPDLIGERWIWSLGAGYGTYDNYTDLNDHTLRKGQVDATNGYFIETETTSGKLGLYERNSGIQLSGSVFKMMGDPSARVNVTPGININSYGLFSSNQLLNANAGVYFAFRTFDLKTRNLNEDFSFGLIADFDSLNDVADDDYAKKHFSVLLSAQIPIRFK